MDKYIEKRAILKHDMLKRQDYEQAGWELVSEDDKSDLAVYGFPKMTHDIMHAKANAFGFCNKITRSIMNGLNRRITWKR